MPFPDTAARTPEGTRIYAVGDVHGRADLLEAMLAEIDRDLHLRTNRAVSFGLFASSSRPMDRPGDLVDVSSQEFIPLPPLATVVKTGRKAARTQVPVHLQAKLTEVGTLEISLAERGGDRRWQLAFGVRHGNDAGTDGTPTFADCET